MNVMEKFCSGIRAAIENRNYVLFENVEIALSR